MIRIYHPSVFQGSDKRNPYFEGWYCKCIDKDQAIQFAVIFGFSFDIEQSHAFIQFIDGSDGETEYQVYPMTDTYISKTAFQIKIGNNELNASGLVLNEQFTNGKYLNVQLYFEQLEYYPVTVLKPGIMGPFRYVPFLECYHAIISCRHNIHGVFTMNGKTKQLTNAIGYMEKDWGVSMPNAWMWSQSNHPKTEEQSDYFLSIANVPLKQWQFTGCIGYIRTKERIYKFSTYTGVRIMAVNDDKEMKSLVLSDCTYIYHFIFWNFDDMGNLKAPSEGRMSRTIAETLAACASVTIYHKRSQYAVFDQEYEYVGLECVRIHDLK